MLRGHEAHSNPHDRIRSNVGHKQASPVFCACPVLILGVLTWLGSPADGTPAYFQFRIASNGGPYLRSERHSMTLSARTRMVCGTVNPSFLALLRLSTSSNFVGCSMGNSAGFAPFKTRST